MTLVAEEKLVFNYMYGLIPGQPLWIKETIVYDTECRDGQWVHVITMDYELVEWDGHEVPAWEGDLERKAWEQARSLLS